MATLGDETTLAPGTTSQPVPPSPGGVASHRWGRRLRRIVLGAALICLVAAGVSFAGAVSQPSNSTVSILAVEWLRDHGARGFVNRVESIYYSLTAPPKGGPGLAALPPQPDAIRAAAARRVRNRYRPRRVASAIAPALAGEGVWHATLANPTRGKSPPLLVTSFRSDPSYPRQVAGVAWIDHTQTRTFLYPGRREPSVSLARGPLAVPSRLRGVLLATFNSGFKLKDSGGGFVVGGRTYAPLREGIATLVGYRGGFVDVRAWNGGPTAATNVLFARQNLPLIVENRRPNPNLGDGPQWGATLGNAVRVWRSGVGVDRHHNLIYAAANAQTVGSLAAILIRAGAVRAMELDINSYWVSFITYRLGGAGEPAKLLASMTRPVTRYLTPDDRDFFAVYAR
ncbi:MAG: hypothetical protein QOF77_1628 [Solirubrobacteraceae bacterium]|jgi:hypothetical protein|nr:hypothetical protein [Solirubrobacteraceae bacterium]